MKQTPSHKTKKTYINRGFRLIFFTLRGIAGNTTVHFDRFREETAARRLCLDQRHIRPKFLCRRGGNAAVRPYPSHEHLRSQAGSNLLGLGLKMKGLI